MVSPRKLAQRQARRAAAPLPNNLTPRQPAPPPNTSMPSGQQVINTGNAEVRIVSKNQAKERLSISQMPQTGTANVRVTSSTGPRSRAPNTGTNVRFVHGKAQQETTKVIGSGGAQPFVRVQQQAQNRPQVTWGTEIGAIKETVKIPDPPADVTVVLSVFERSNFLRTQFENLKNQSRPPAAMLAVISSGDVPHDERTLVGSKMAFLRSNVNIGPWARFTMAMEVPTKYVCILDDDTLPGPCWIEDAVDRLEQAEKTGEGPYCIACAGEVFRSDNPSDSYRIGPESARPDEIEVDVGRGGWIFRKDLLPLFMSLPRQGDGRIGWDMHLAVALSMEDVLTLVLPYEYGNTQSWGMIQPPVKDEHSISFKINAEASQGGMNYEYRRGQLYQAYRMLGWKPIVLVGEDSDESEEAEEELQNQGA